MDVDTGNSFPTWPPAPRVAKRALSQLHKNPTDSGVRKKDQKKEMLRWPVNAASGAALTQPWLSARARGSFSRWPGLRGKGNLRQKTQEAKWRVSGQWAEGQREGCAWPLGHPTGSPCHVWGRDRVDVLHDGLDPIPPDSRRHSGEGEGALLCLNRRRGVSSDRHLPTPEKGPAGRPAARWLSQECGMCPIQDEQSWRAKERAKSRTLSWQWLTRASFSPTAAEACSQLMPSLT